MGKSKGFSSKWTLDDGITKNIKKFPQQFDNVVGTYLDYQAGKVQDYMRSNATWTDQTGNARQGLFAVYRKSGNAHTIIVYHTMPYGIYLETRFDGKFAIIQPTLLHFGPKLMAGASGLIGKMSA